MTSTATEMGDEAVSLVAGRHAKPQDERRVSLLALCLLALGVGLLTGLGGVFFRWLIGLIHNFMFNGVLQVAYDANALEGPSRFGNLSFCR